MKLLRKLGTRLNKNGTPVSYGEFLCPNIICNKIVEMPLSDGYKCKSCGCNRINNLKLHGGSYTRLYIILKGMKDRCYNINNKAYKNYGGREITICDEWLDKDNGFINFRNWALTNGYKESLEIDRINNNGNYEPNNCKWNTSTENNRNKRTTKLTLDRAKEIRYLHSTGDYTQKQLAYKFSVAIATISYTINNKRWV